MARIYKISGTTWSGEIDEDEIDDYHCQYCCKSINEMGIPLLHEDAYGAYFCEETDCVWQHISDTYYIEIEDIIDSGEEE